MSEASKNSIETHNDEIDLIELVKVVWSRKWFIAKITFGFVALGLLIAFTSPKEYETSCTLIPEAMNSEGKLGGSLGGLASLAGIDLGGMSGGVGTINPGLYQSVARSTPFLLTVLDQRYYFAEEGLELSIRGYYQEYYKTSLLAKFLGFPGQVIGWIKTTEQSAQSNGESTTIISLSLAEQSMLDNLKGRISVTLDYELNVVSVVVEMQDALVAAQLAEYTQGYITDYATAYSISKSKEQLLFIETQYNHLKKEFEKAQLNLARFRDRNRNINTAQAKSEEERLQSEYNLTFNVYNQVAQQLETIKLQVNENTPVFTVLEPPKVPVNKSEPKRILIIVVCSVLGLFIALGVLFLKVILKNVTAANKN